MLFLLNKYKKKFPNETVKIDSISLSTKSSYEIKLIFIFNYLIF